MAETPDASVRGTRSIWQQPRVLIVVQGGVPEVTVDGFAEVLIVDLDCEDDSEATTLPDGSSAHIIEGHLGSPDFAKEWDAYKSLSRPSGPDAANRRISATSDPKQSQKASD